MRYIVFALLSASLACRTAGAADLLAIYHEALAQDAALASAKASYLAGQEKAPQGKALLLPSIGLGANTTYNDVDFSYRGPTSLPAGKRSYNSNGWTLTLTQPLYRPQNWAAYEEGKLQAAQAGIQYGSARQDLMLRVAQAYFDVLLAQDSAALAKSQKQAILEQLEQAKLSFEVGTATITDTNEAQARYDLANAGEIAALSELEIKRRSLEVIIGKVAESLVPLGEGMPLQAPQPDDMEKWVNAAQEGNLQIQIQKAALEIAGREVERNRAGHYPTLDAVASYGSSAASNSNFGVGNDTKATAIGLQFNLPLYQGGGISSRVREALANQEKARHDLDQVSRQTALSTRSAYLGVTSGAAQVKALEQALVSSQSSLDSTKLGMEVGVRTNVDVLNAQQQLYSAKRDLYKARYAYLVSGLQLKAAAGILGEEDLEEVNRWLK